jgi:hypothetical protein
VQGVLAQLRAAFCQVIRGAGLGDEYLVVLVEGKDFCYN